MNRVVFAATEQTVKGRSLKLHLSDGSKSLMNIRLTNGRMRSEIISNGEKNNRFLDTTVDQLLCVFSGKDLRSISIEYSLFLSCFLSEVTAEGESVIPFTRDVTCQFCFSEKFTF